jgi:hypothetical protein
METSEFTNREMGARTDHPPIFREYDRRRHRFESFGRKIGGL